MQGARRTKIIDLAAGTCQDVLRKLAPPLTRDTHKGQAGRVAVIGGSKDYTGAPYYAATAALKFGADLAYVFCAEEASQPIKSYSPELMVTAFYNSSAINVATITGALPRLHALTLGPGLGRSNSLFEGLATVIAEAKAMRLPMVIDADGLYMLSSDSRFLDLIRGYRECILTPNKAEFDRLAQAVAVEAGDDEARLRALSASLDKVTILLKGRDDLVSDGGDVVLRVQAPGSPRRCGGQGDVLAGALTVAAYWAQNNKADEEQEGLSPSMWACVLASLVTKRSAELAFEDKKRSTTTPDILEKVGRSFEEISPSS